MVLGQISQLKILEAVLNIEYVVVSDSLDSMNLDQVSIDT